MLSEHLASKPRRVVPESGEWVVSVVVVLHSRRSQ
jgi:hypothetical protein